MTRKLLILTIVGVFVLTSLALATDLKWRSPIEISPVAPSAGDTVTFRCKLKSGGGTADGILVEGRIDGAKVWDHTYPHFDTDELTWVEFTWVATGGTHTVAFVIDPMACSVDANPDNNTRSVSFDVTAGGGTGTTPGGTLTLTSIPREALELKPKIRPEFLKFAKISLNLMLEPKIRRNLTEKDGKRIWGIYGKVKSEFHNVKEVWVRVSIASSTYNHSENVLVTDLTPGQYKTAYMYCEAPDGVYVGVITVDPDNLLKEKKRGDNTIIRSVSLEVAK